MIWEITRACQLACLHCRADAIRHRDPFELTTTEGKELLDDLAAFGPPRPLLVLTGGDPLERSDLVDLVSHGTALGLSVSLSPSVTPRLTRAALAELQSAGVRTVSLSLDGATPATHDAFRGIDGVFAATEETIRIVGELGLRLQVNTTVTQQNVAELPAILDRVYRAHAALWSVFFLVPVGRGRRLKALSPREEEAVLHWLYEVSAVVPVKTTEAPQYRRVVVQRMRGENPPLGEPLFERLRASTSELFRDAVSMRSGFGSRRPPLDINAGRGFAFIDHRGLVYPSGFLPHAVGSVRAAPFSVIYREAPLLRALRDPDALGGKCGRCEFRTICGGSRSRAFALTGDPLAEDAMCAYQL